MLIKWDDSKRMTNLAKHELDFADLSPEFFEHALVTSARTARYKAIGWLADQWIITVVFAPLGSEAISVISMRPASQKERRAYVG
jgi:uncharacterized protein